MNHQSQSTQAKSTRQDGALQVIQGGRVKPNLVLAPRLRKSIADSFRYHDAKLSTLAWETGHTQHVLCGVIAEASYTEGVAIGRQIERNLIRFQMGQAA